jgi:dethiobiotin synthetase
MHVAGTGTSVGKTVVTAAIAALAAARGDVVTVMKPAQSGIDDAGEGDTQVVLRLTGSGVQAVELARYPAALSPAAAAQLSGRTAVTVADCRRAYTLARRSADLILVEGSGGLLVPINSTGETLADVAVDLGLPVVVVTSPELGTLNATALTLEALRHRGLRLFGLVIGSWPQQPGLAERRNLRDLCGVAGEPLAGVLPTGMAALDVVAFLEVARRGLDARFGGIFDLDGFEASAV